MRFSRRGHNLLEVIIATFIFLTLVVVTSGLWISYSRSIAKSRDHLVATHLGKTIIENAVDAGFDSAVSDGPSTLEMELETDGRVTKIPYTYSTTVTRPEAGLKRIIVSISYEFQGRTSELSFETLLSAKR